METLVSTEVIENKVFLIRGQKVMLDRDLAMLYEVETKVLNQAVKRNFEKFPDDFMFKLNDNELKELVANCDRFKSLKHSTSAPYAFTDYGVAMLSNVLKSKKAIAVNIQIIKLFSKLRTMAIEHKDLRDELLEMKNAFINYARDNNLELEEIYRQLDYLNDITKPTQIGFKATK